MAVIIKSNNSILQKVGVPADLVSSMGKLGIQLVTAFYSVQFNDQAGNKLSEVKIPGISTNEIMKGKASPSAIKVIQTNLIAGLTAAIQKVQAAPPADPSTPVRLKDATKMYQKVMGTNAGSTYFVVAMNDRVKVAARIRGNDVSFRVEGDLKQDVIEAFTKVGLSAKAGYMSGHMTCSPQAPANRVIGAVLLGSGLEFATPVPNCARVVE